MSSYVEISNLALSRIGASQMIDSLGERSKEAEMLSLHLPVCRRTVLREFPWNFASKRVALALLKEMPQGRWRFQYALPADCLCARELIRHDAGPCDWRFPETRNTFELGVDDALTVRTVLSNIPQAWLCYTADVEGPALFDVLFTDALGWKLASAVALPLASSAEVSKLCDTRYQQLMHAAWAAQMNESRMPHEPDFGFVWGRQ